LGVSPLPLPFLPLLDQTFDQNQTRAATIMHQDNTPLWKTINEDYCVLTELRDVQYPDLMRSLRNESETYMKLKPPPQNASTCRIDSLEVALRNVNELKCKLSSAIEKVRNNLLVYALSEDISERELVSTLSPVAHQAYLFHVADLHNKPHDRNPYATFNAVMQNLMKTIAIYKIVRRLHVPKITQTAFLLYEKTKGKPQKDIATATLPNWPGMYCCFQTLHNINESIKQHANSLNGGLCLEEAQHLETRLQVIKCYLFNSPDAHKSIHPKEVELQDVDLTPFQYKQEYELLFEFLSTADYVMDSFKKIVVDHTPYNIIKIDGDGNCFFRAIIRHTYPSISRNWEDKLSLGLRQRLNQGEERQLQENGKGSEYTFHGFVIENVNDSLTMAKAGVWADHVQVQKLSILLKNPLFLYTFDDVTIRMDKNGILRPGKDYMIGTHYEGSPISLYYTPSPGHYEVMMLPQPPELRTSLEEDIIHLEYFLETTRVPHIDLPAQNLCSVFFRLEAEVSLIEQVAKQGGWLAAREIKQAIDAEVHERSTAFFSSFSRYRRIIKQLGLGYLLENYSKKPDFNLHAEVLCGLLEYEFDSSESLLNKLSRRVASVYPGGVSGMEDSLVLPPPPTTSPLLLAANKTGPMTPQSYCTLPEPKESSLFASPHTTEEQWAERINQKNTSVLDLRDSLVTGDSLRALARAIRNTNIAFVKLSRCTFDQSACQVLGDVNVWPLKMQRIELHNCRLFDTQIVGANNHVKQLGCRVAK
jgi:hypothetical protein